MLVSLSALQSVYQNKILTACHDELAGRWMLITLAYEQNEFDGFLGIETDEHHGKSWLHIFSKLVVIQLNATRNKRKIVAIDEYKYSEFISRLTYCSLLRLKHHLNETAFKLSSPEVHYSDNSVIITGYANGIAISHSASVEVDFTEGLLMPVIKDHFAVDGQTITLEDFDTFLLHGNVQAQVI